MAVTRNSLKNRFISVNNNFSSTLRSAIGIGSRDISLIDTPTKLGNFGYITIDNSKGGQIIFFSKNSGNTLTTVRGSGGRGQDNTIARAAGGGSLTQQRVVAANVTQNQAAILSILQANHLHGIGTRGTDPNRDQFVLSDGGFTGTDKIRLKSIIVRSTSAQYSIGRQIKKAFDKHYVNRMRGSGNVYGSSMSYNLSIANLQGSQPYAIQDYSATGDIAAGTFNSLNLGATNSTLFNVPNKSSSAWNDEGIYYGSYISSLWRNNPSPLFVHRKDIIFINKTMNPLGLLKVADGSSLQTNTYGLMMNPNVSSLQNKVQLFNVRPASIYQPYTVVSTHHDSRIDSQLLRKDSDFFMSTYNSAGTQASTGGTLTVRRSIGNGISGDRWRLAYNKNLLVDGRNFHESGYFLNDALTAWNSGSFLKTNCSWTADILAGWTVVTPIYQQRLNRGWIYIQQRYTAVKNAGYWYSNGRSDQNSQNYVCLHKGGKRIFQFVEFSQSLDKIGNFCASFFATDNSVFGTIGLNDLRVFIYPVFVKYDSGDYRVRSGNNQSLSSGLVSQTSISDSIRTNSGTNSISLYSVSASLPNWGNTIDKFCGLLFRIGVDPNASHTGYLLTDIKLQQGLQRTRYVQQRQRVTSKISYDSIRGGLNIQANSYSGNNLWICNKSHKDRVTQTAEINFGKNIPYGIQSDDPYISITANTFFSQATSAQYDNSFGASLRLTSALTGIIDSNLLQYTSYTQQKFGLVNLGRQIAITHAINSNSSLKRTNGISLRTFDYTNGTTTGHLGNILIDANASTASKILMYSNSHIIQNTDDSCQLNNKSMYIKSGADVPHQYPGTFDYQSNISSCFSIQGQSNIQIFSSVTAGQTLTGYLTDNNIVYDRFADSILLVSVQRSYIWWHPSPAYWTGNIIHNYLNLSTGVVGSGQYSYILSTTRGGNNSGFGQMISLASFTAVSPPADGIIIFFQPHTGTLPGYTGSQTYFKIGFKLHMSDNTSNWLKTLFKIRCKRLTPS